MYKKVKNILKKYRYDILLYFLALLAGLLFVGGLQKVKAGEYEYGEPGEYESGNVIQKQVITINDTNVYDLQHFLGFVQIYDYDVQTWVDSPWLYEWANYMQGMTKDLVVTPTEPGLYYYIPSLDHVSRRPIASIIVKYSYISIIHMDGTIYEVRRSDSVFTEIQLVYNDWSYYGDSYYQGFNNGKDAGYDIGLDAGKDIWYDIGLDAGYDIGLDAGKDIGYNNGWNVGYNKGLIDNPNNNFGTMIASILVGVGTVLSIQLLPNISIGAIIAVPIVFGIIAFVLGRRKE